jgi:hypothetical protein
VSSFDDNPAVLHVFDLHIPPVERYVKIPMSGATLLSIKGSAPGIKAIAGHEPGAQACGFRRGSLDDKPRGGERAARILSECRAGLGSCQKAED